MRDMRLDEKKLGERNIHCLLRAAKIVALHSCEECLCLEKRRQKSR